MGDSKFRRATCPINKGAAAGRQKALKQREILSSTSS